MLMVCAEYPGDGVKYRFTPGVLRELLAPYETESSRVYREDRNGGGVEGDLS
jgi:hypothetical protein